MREAREIGVLSALLARLEMALAALSGIAIAAIMVIVCIDVVMRYLFAAPLGWSYDVIGVYLMVGVFFLALSDTLHHHAHIAIDVFQASIPHRLRHLGLGLGYLAASLVLALIAWQAWLRLEAAWIAGDRLGSVLAWPTWPSYLLVVVGAAVITLRSALRTLGHLASAATGRDLVEMPPPPASTAEEGEL